MKLSFEEKIRSNINKMAGIKKYASQNIGKEKTQLSWFIPFSVCYSVHFIFLSFSLLDIYPLFPPSLSLFICLVLLLFLISLDFTLPISISFFFFSFFFSPTKPVKLILSVFPGKVAPGHVLPIAFYRIDLHTNWNAIFKKITTHAPCSPCTFVFCFLVTSRSCQRSSLLDVSDQIYFNE